MDITLYGSGTTRSARCRWTLAEAGVEYTLIERSGLIGSDELRAMHPLAKLPAADIDGQPLFESAAICTYIADRSPKARLVAEPGTMARAWHDQWVAFCLTEMEAWLWNTAVNSFVLPEEKRVTAGFEQNASMFKRSAAAMDRFLESHDYLVADRFTVPDIIVGWCANWGRRGGHLSEMPALSAYVERLLERPHCTFARD